MSQSKWWLDNVTALYISSNIITRQYQCCGGKSPDDWITLQSVEEAANGNKNIPISCCVHEVDVTNSQCTDHFKGGCLNIIHEIVSNHVAMISLFALGVAVVQVHIPQFFYHNLLTWEIFTIFKMIGIFAAYLHNKAIRKRIKLDDADYTKLTTKSHNFY